MEILKELFPKALMVPYATPGVALAKAYFKTYMESENRDTSGITTSFLQNHGLIVSGDSPEVVMNETESIVKKIENFLNINFSGYRRVTEIWRLFPERIVWKVTDFKGEAFCQSAFEIVRTMRTCASVSNEIARLLLWQQS